MSQPMEERVHSTYRYLRVIAVLPAVWLLLAMAVVWVVRGEVFDSISDYYGGPLRDVFVGALMASGICLVAYKGESKLEDYALNFAGINAFFVALVPNSFPDLLDEASAAEDAGEPLAVGSADLLQNLGIAVGTFVVVVGIFIVVDSLFFKWTRFSWAEQGRLANVLIGLSWVAEIVLAGVVLFVVVTTLAGDESTWAFTAVHFGAASLLVLNLAFAAASHAFPGRLRTAADAPADPRKIVAAFRFIVIAMTLGIVAACIAIPADVPYAVIAVEVWEIVLFIIFWILATRSEWRRAGAPA
ncbi:hypothetical protein [Nocardioides antri]|uniref:hypothetical protein n=1 Tax=Nocardioides antri TaxID=2607659 RepID=UPI00122C7443|nr:hypothetical protein [Nocardioides antri]